MSSDGEDESEPFVESNDTASACDDEGGQSDDELLEAAPRCKHVRGVKVNVIKQTFEKSFSAGVFACSSCTGGTGKLSKKAAKRVPATTTTSADPTVCSLARILPDSSIADKPLPKNPFVEFAP